VKNAFFANYLAALLMLKIQDLKGLMLINDRSHANLTKFSPSMSDLNFWGRALFYSNDADVKNRMRDGEASILYKEAGMVSTPRIQKIMKVPLTAPDHVDWADTIAALLLLKHRFSIRSTYFDSIVRTLHNWESINIGSKQKAINDSFMYLMQSDPHSCLLPRLRVQSTATLANKLQSVAQRIVSFTRINEEGEGGGDSVGAISTGNIASNSIVNPTDNDGNSQDLGGLFKLIKRSPNQVEKKKKSKYTIRNGKIIVKKAKNFDPIKFKAPDFLRPKKEKKAEKKNSEVDD
jgi:hypothetical protein